MEKKYSYPVIILFFFLSIGLGFLYKHFLINLVVIPDCIIYKYLGIYCPGCGGTRAFLSFINFDFLGSIYYNPIIVYAFLFLIIAIISMFNKKFYNIFISNIYVYVFFGILLLVLNCIIKNYFLLHFNFYI